MAGVIQSIMLALSMVVTASLVGAPGLGADVYRAVSQIDVGQGFEAGLSIVFIAIILDRITQNLRKPAYGHAIKPKIVFSIFAILVIGTAIVVAITENKAPLNGNPDGIGAQTDHEIIGIEPGAGIMELTNTALEEYELDDWVLREGSSAAMVAELQKAYNNQEPIIITVWSPHWMFSSFDLKYLEDPKGAFGGSESIHTIVRKGLEQDAPGAYTILDQFSWEPSDMEAVMVDVTNGMDPSEAAKKWVDANPDKVSNWTSGAASGNGEPINLVFVAWDTEIASTYVIGRVLQQHGYDVTLDRKSVV